MSHNAIFPRCKLHRNAVAEEVRIVKSALRNLELNETILVYWRVVLLLLQCVAVASTPRENCRKDLFVGQDRLGMLLYTGSLSFYSQNFQYTFIKEFKQDETCLDVHEQFEGAKVHFFACHEMRGNQEFVYTEVGSENNR